MSECQSTSNSCSFQGCGRPSLKKGFCGAHYQQHKAGKPLTPVRVRIPNGDCVFPGCGRKATARGLCSGHVAQQKSGRELSPIKHQRAYRSPPDIAGNIKHADCPTEGLKGPCHIWQGFVGPDGYGRTSFLNKNVMAHRAAWEQVNGPIPKGLVIDHICRVRSCCNPDHLRCVTQNINVTENVVGAAWQLKVAKTHCPKGHPYDEENTWFDRKRNPKTVPGFRHCRACHRERERARRAKLKEC